MYRQPNISGVGSKAPNILLTTSIGYNDLIKCLYILTGRYNYANKVPIVVFIVADM